MDKDILILFELKYLKILQAESLGYRVLLNPKASAIIKSIGNYFYKTDSKDAEKIFKTLFPYFNYKVKAEEDIKNDIKLKNKIKELLNEL